MSIGRRKQFQSWRFERYPFIIALTEGWSSKRQLWNSLRWPNYIFNSVDKTKLSYIKVQLIFLYPPLTQQHRFFKILPSLNIQGLEASMHPPLRLTFANKIVLGKIHWKIDGLICLNVLEFQYAIWIMELHHIHDSLHAPSNFNGQPSLIQTSNSIALFVKHLMICTEPATDTLEFSLIRY